MSGDSMLKIIDMDTGEGLDKREDLVNFITADPEMSMQKFAHGLLMVLTDGQMLDPEETSTDIWLGVMPR